MCRHFEGDLSALGRSSSPINYVYSKKKIVILEKFLLHRKIISVFNLISSQVELSHNSFNPMWFSIYKKKLRSEAAKWRNNCGCEQNDSSAVIHFKKKSSIFFLVIDVGLEFTMNHHVLRPFKHSTRAAWEMSSCARDWEGREDHRTNLALNYFPFRLQNEGMNYQNSISGSWRNLFSTVIFIFAEEEDVERESRRQHGRKIDKFPSGMRNDEFVRLVCDMSGNDLRMNCQSAS